MRSLFAISVLGVGLLLLMAAPRGSALANVSGDPGPDSLCTRNEKVIFSCRIEKSTKLLSVCGSKDLDQTKGYLQYRFGRTGAVELQFPADRQNTQKQFSYERYTRPLVTYLTLSFETNGYQYSLHQDYNGEEKPQVYDSRIEIAKAGTGGESRELKCSGRAYGSLMSLEDFVPKSDDAGHGLD
jgi:hypothetical protein